MLCRGKEEDKVALNNVEYINAITILTMSNNINLLNLISSLITLTK